MIKKQCKNLMLMCINIKELVLPKMKTEYEKKAWKSFEKILEIRSLLGLIFWEFVFIGLIINGTAPHQL